MSTQREIREHRHRLKDLRQHFYNPDELLTVASLCDGVDTVGMTALKCFSRTRKKRIAKNGKHSETQSTSIEMYLEPDKLTVDDLQLPISFNSHSAQFQFTEDMACVGVPSEAPSYNEAKALWDMPPRDPPSVFVVARSEADIVDGISGPHLFVPGPDTVEHPETPLFETTPTAFVVFNSVTLQESLGGASSPAPRQMRWGAPMARCEAPGSSTPP